MHPRSSRRRNHIVLPALPPLTDNRVDAEVESVASEQQSEGNSISQASNHYDSRLVSVVSFKDILY